MERHGLAGRWAYWDAINDVYHGLTRERVRALYAEADALINLCGATRLREEHMRCPVRHHDRYRPGLRADQIRQGRSGGRAPMSTRIPISSPTAPISARPAAPVPLCGVPWRPTRPPVDLDLWPAAEATPACFTTIATWENKGKNIEFERRRLCLVEARQLPAIPRPAAAAAAGLFPDGDAAARRGGRSSEVEGRAGDSTDPRPVSADMDDYRDFIAGSRGEFTVAKDIYVRPNSGWFSDRARLLPRRRPAGRDDATGFDKFYPVGRGLFRIRNASTRRLPRSTRSRPIIRAHSRAAREIAARIFRRRPGDPPNDGRSRAVSGAAGPPVFPVDSGPNLRSKPYSNMNRNEPVGCRLETAYELRQHLTRGPP